MKSDWYEVRRFLKGSNGNDDGSGVTYYNTLKQAQKAKIEAEISGKYEVVYIEHLDGNGVID